MSPDSLWYFAFGSNMSSKVFRGRRKMHPVSSESAELRGYELVFDHPGLPLLEPSFANIKPSKDNSVFGVLYNMTRREMNMLNTLEGGGAYQNLELEVIGENGARRVAHVFWTPNTGITHLFPSKRYISVLVTGAKEHNLPHEWIRFLQSHSTSPHYFLLSHAMKIMMPTLNILYRLGFKRPFENWREKQHKKAQVCNLDK